MSDISQAAAAVWEKFIQLEQSDSTAKKILQKINSGAANYEDLQDFSNWMSINLVKLASESFPEDSQAVLDALNDMSVCRNYFSHIDDAIKTVQKSMNEAAGIGLQPVSMNHPRQLMDATTSSSDNYAADIQKFSQALIDTSQKHVDLAELQNARFQAGAGCEVTVTRKYDHVGLRNRKQACAWCLSRVGTDVPYKEAVARGMFERHEGCGCTIIYHSEKGTTVQRRSGGRDSWESEAERNKRIQFSNSDQNGSGKQTKNQYRKFFEEKVESGEIADKVNKDLQKKHLEGNSNGRSYLYGNEDSAERLYQRLHFTGEPVFDKKGNWTHKERVEDDEPVGVSKDEDGSEKETSKAMIVYSKTGSHIYPR